MFQAIQKLDFETINQLVTSESDFKNMIQKSSLDSVLHIAVRTGNKLLIQCLLDLGADSCLNSHNKDGKTPLHEAVQFASADIVDLLIKRGSKVDALKRGDWTPLMLASAKDNLVIIQALLSAGASLRLFNKDGWTAFHIACRTGLPEIVNCILDLDSSAWNCKSFNGRTPLHTAALHGHQDILRILLDRGHYVPNEQDSCGNTPFMDCVRSGNLNAVKLLMLDCRTDLHIRDKMGRQAIHLAAEAGQLSIVNYLITESFVDAESVSVNGQTPLHFASAEGHISVAQCLLRLGSNINAKDLKGRTALWMAGSCKKLDCFQVLALYGAVDEPDNNGIYPSTLILPG